MYWRFAAIPELSDLPPDEQRRLWAEAARDRSRRSDLLVVALLVILVMAVASPLLFISIWAKDRLSPWIGWPLWFIAMMCSWKLTDVVMVRHYRRVVRRLRGK